MAALQLEAGCQVVESGRLPASGRMARGAIIGDARRNMAREGRLCKARGMATVAGCRGPRKRGHMARRTRHGCMFARQREAGRRVVENAVEPVGFRMALGTVRWVAQLYVLGRTIVLRLVATGTFGFRRCQVPLVA